MAPETSPKKFKIGAATEDVPSVLSLDTILYYTSGLVEQLPPAINALGMFILQMLINFVVPSGSGQAALTMPIMTPLADLVGMSRQTGMAYLI